MESKAFDFHGDEKRLNNLLSAIQASTIITPQNKKLILSFYELLVGKELKAGTTRRRIQMMKMLAEKVKKDFDKTDRKDVEKLIFEIANMKISEYTKVMYRVTLKTFYEWMRGVEKPPEVSWIQIRPKNFKEKTIDKKELITKEELDKMLAAASNPRDKAFLMCLWEGGFRVQELAQVKIKDIKFRDKGVEIKVTGKGGKERIPLLVHSEPYLAAWLNIHPNRKDDEHVWVSVDYRKKRIPKYESFVEMLHKVKERAGIKKRIHFHLFRHTAASNLYDMGFDVPHIETRGGWVPGSRMMGRYIHRDEKASNNAYLTLNGIKPEEEKLQIKHENVTCQRCGKKNTADAAFCYNCGLALDMKAIVKENETRAKTGEEIIALLKTPGGKEILKEIWRPMIAAEVKRQK